MHITLTPEEAASIIRNALQAELQLELDAEVRFVVGVDHELIQVQVETTVRENPDDIPF